MLAALCRASIRVKNRRLGAGSIKFGFVKSDIRSYYFKIFNTEFIKSQENTDNRLLSTTKLYATSSFSSKSYSEIRTFSSQDGPKSSLNDEGDLEEGFSEFETPIDSVQESNSKLSNEEGGTEIDVGAKKSPQSGANSPMATAIASANHTLSVSKLLDEWVEEGNEVTRTQVSLAILELMKRRKFAKALLLLEWIESKKHLDFLEDDYASRVYLIAKARGLPKAERYFQQIPESFRGELVYRTLLARYVSTNQVKKAEELFNKMKNSSIPITCFSCNKLLMLYKMTEKKKIDDVLLFMERENIKPNRSTYQILIDIKSESNDITGIEKIVETMRTEGFKPNPHMLASLARYYLSVGNKDKAEYILKEMEGDDINENRSVIRLLLPIYASLGREDEVGRIWKVCESDPEWEECMAAIESWGRLKRVENSEAAFDKMVKRLKRPSCKHFTPLLKVYADNKMLKKGEDLVKRMEDSGCMVGPVALDAIVKLYTKVGKVEKADSTLEKSVKQKSARPTFDSYSVILYEYAKKGDVHNAEKIFRKMRRDEYVFCAPMYQTLLNAYINAKTPAYGFRERMKADNVFVDEVINRQLARVDPFRKSEVDELLE